MSVSELLLDADPRPGLKNKNMDVLLFLALRLKLYNACAGGETVDTPALGAGAARHGGSSPLSSTVFVFSRT